jgi:hypothetical protein
MRDVHRERKRAGECRAAAARDSGTLAAGGGQPGRFLLRESATSRAAARRADAPHPAAAHARRNAP